VGMTWVTWAKCTFGGLMTSHEFAAGFLRRPQQGCGVIMALQLKQPTNVQHAKHHQPPQVTLGLVEANSVSHVPSRLLPANHLALPRSTQAATRHSASSAMHMHQPALYCQATQKPVCGYG
jgi:hypothetical protein